MRALAAIAFCFLMFAAGILVGMRYQHEIGSEQTTAKAAIIAKWAPKFKLGPPLQLPADSD